MTGRDEPALRPPPIDPDALRGFPRWTLTSSRRVWRCHRADRGPWWFASTGDGRFDLPEPDGTCYLAGSAETAVREVFGAKLLSAGVVTPAVLAGRVVSVLRIAQPARLADTRNANAVSVGVTREISTITPYVLPQRWAVAFRAAGCAGVRYEPRHTSGAREVSFAVFGPHGRRDWPVDPSPRPAAAVVASVGVSVAAAPRRPGVIAPPA